MHGPTPTERKIMDDWVRDLASFVRGDKAYSYGTQAANEHKVLTPQGTIDVQIDERWEELLRLMEVFAG